MSEPLGIMLVNERMLESYVESRRWLKPGGRMYPNASTMFVAPFSDSALHLEASRHTQTSVGWPGLGDDGDLQVSSKASFFHMTSFHGVDMTSLFPAANAEYFRQPCIEQVGSNAGAVGPGPFSLFPLNGGCEQVNPACLVGPPSSKRLDFQTMDKEALHEVRNPLTAMERSNAWLTRLPRPTNSQLTFDVDYTFEHAMEVGSKCARVGRPPPPMGRWTCQLHGLASWFDAEFTGTDRALVLSTAPSSPLTHWYQVRARG